MSAAAERARSVVVAGDVTMDWHLARTTSVGSDGSVWNARDSAQLYGQGGGAALLAEAVTAVARELEAAGSGACRVLSSFPPSAPVFPLDPRFHHSFAIWKLETSARSGKLADEPKAWRVEEFLGLSRAQTPATSSDSDSLEPNGERASTDLVLLDDAALGFRDAPASWPRALSPGACRWVLLKMAAPIAEGQLWKRLHAQLAERVIAVMTVNDLRRSEVQISRELSWERTAQDLYWELVHNPRVNALAQCAHVVVSFDTAGALLLSAPSEGRERSCRLFFDPAVIEGEWAAEYPGGMVGYTTCLAAGLARELVLRPESPDLGSALQRGLAAMRHLHRAGYGVRGREAPHADLRFPAETVAAELAEEGQGFSEVEVRDPMRAAPRTVAPKLSPAAAASWTILQERYPGGLERLAERIVRIGPERALAGVPLGRFGDLVAIDRQEIEAYRGIRALMVHYLSRGLRQAPLSIAVFGAPGSGKSFGVAQVAKSLPGGQIGKPLTFNLSQFAGAGDLRDALHQVRDVGLGGLVPLVFWDEFDARTQEQPLGWLAQFLAPMQDGVFQEGQVSHPIGRAIFVFAGGTKSSMVEFARRSEAELEAFRAAKGPDFVSRIRAFVDIVGANPVGRDPAADPYFIVRRAILLRSLLRRLHAALFQRDDGTEELQIDSGVLRAFLNIAKYEHGVRSIESIVTLSHLHGKHSFERSALPSEVQLSLHVNGPEFLAQVQQIDLEGDLLERLAAEVHNSLCDRLRTDGYRSGPVTDDDRRTHSSLVPYADLPEDEKEQNRGNARDIPNKLAAGGYVMLPARSNPPPFEFPGPDLELLASMEHERWLRMKLEAGWRWATVTDKPAKRHADLVPWSPLTPEECGRRFSAEDAGALGAGPLAETAREKDRALVREIPRVLARIGYSIVRARAGKK